MITSFHSSKNRFSVTRQKSHLFGTSLSGDAVDQYAVTDKDGVATFKDVLISGSEPYTLEEVDTAIRYVVPKNQTAPVKWKEVTTRNFNNILKKFTVTVTKSDAEKGEAQGNAKLSGAVYGIYKGETLVDKYVTAVSYTHLDVYKRQAAVPDNEVLRWCK